MLHVSIASLWECAIKSSIGKLDIPKDFFEIVSQDYELLDIEVPHIELCATCPCTIATPLTECWWRKPSLVDSP